MALIDYSLFNSLIDNSNPGGYLANITALTPGLNRSKQWQGGDWIGTLTITDATLGQMQDLYHDAIGWHFEETTNGETSWAGMVYEMDIIYGGLRRRRTLDDLFNSVYTRYTDTDGILQNTAATSQSESIVQYGQKDEILTSRLASSTIATDQRDVFFKEHNWPYSKTVAKANSEISLEMVMVGYAFTGNWRFTTQDDGTTDNLSDYITDIVTNDMEYLTAGVITANTVQVYRYLQTPTRAWDVVMDLVAIGDGSQGATRAWVDRAQFLNYETVDYNDVAYYWDGGLKENIGTPYTIEPRLVEPGIVRDLTDIIGIEGFPDSDFTQQTDFLIEGVSVNEAGDLSFTIGEQSESEIYNEYAAFLDRRERQLTALEKGQEASIVTGKTSGKRERSPNVQRRINQRRKKKLGLL